MNFSFPSLFLIMKLRETKIVDLCDSFVDSKGNYLNLITKNPWKESVVFSCLYTKKTLMIKC